LRIAILGCGSIGRRHARNLVALGQTDLVLFDPDPAARAILEGVPSTCFVDTVEEVWWSRPQVVFVTSPPHLHVALSLEAARHGCHVFIEKPLSNSLDWVDELSAEIEKRGLVSIVGCNMRFHPGPSRVKALLDERTIGRVVSARIHTGSYLPEWRPGTDYRRSYSASEAMGGGAILDCIHEIDLALWYFGPGRLLAAASTPAETIGLDVEGVAEILIRHESGVLSSVHLNFVQRDYRRSCLVVGSEGTIEWDWQAGSVRRLAPGEEPCRWLLPSDWVVNDMYVSELRHFLECVAERRATANPVGRAIEAMNLALEAKRVAGVNH
jgi:predicted dehydrogenase